MGVGALALPQRDPTPQTPCATPLVRPRPQPTEHQLWNDLLVWTRDNPHIRTGYVLLAPDLAHLVPLGGVKQVSGTLFHVQVFDGVPKGDLWGIAANCGDLY